MLLSVGLGAWLSAARTAGQDATRPIQDNSFLLEEAYNQEEGVVQHINQFVRNGRTGEWSYSFTQEWPVPGQAHQLSYTIPYQRVKRDGAASTGAGDVALNYRYQLAGSGEAHLALAPRVSLLLPTGNERRGLGSGGTALQFDLPMSLVLSERWVSHSNAGLTETFSARDERGQRADTRGWNLGQSVILHAARKLDLMLEFVWTRFEVVSGPGKTRASTAALINPGVRWAYDFASGLQIVPGVAFPIGVGPSGGQRSVLLYLSFEHPFRRAPARPER
jgi:hypothetical protein